MSEMTGRGTRTVAQAIISRIVPGPAAAAAAAVFLLGFVAIATAAASPAASADGKCVQETPSVFHIDGPIDGAMRDCVRSRLGAATRELVVSSGGGDIEAALDIADLVARPRLTVRVREKCYSSCANYLIPLASRLVIEPGSTIVVHGGVDPRFIVKGHLGRRSELIRQRLDARPDLSRAQVEADFEATTTRMRALAERQKHFAARHGVGPGWFLYREPDERDFGRFLEGTPGRRPSIFGWRYLLVEEPMLTSCLPRVQVAPYQADLEASFFGNRDRYRRFTEARGRRSLDLRCTSGQPS